MVAHQEELRLVSRVVGGDTAAIAEFLGVAQRSIWPAVVILTGEGRAENTFLDVISGLKADGFARLKRYDGRSQLSTFLTLQSRDLLAMEIAGGFAAEPDRAWRAFERLFGGAIRARIRCRFPRADEARQNDLFQEVAVRLVEDGYRRIRSFGGYGSFSGYILTAVDRILIDLLRQEAPRRRLPADVIRMSPLHHAIYAAIVWRGCPCNVDDLARMLHGNLKPEPTRDEMAAALGDLAGPIAAAGAAPAKPVEVSIDAGTIAHDAIADPFATADEILIDHEEETAREAVIAAVKQAAAALPDDERFYLQTILTASDPLPAREIARQMGVAVEEVYRLRQRVQRWMRQIASDLQKNAPCPSDMQRTA